MVGLFGIGFAKVVVVIQEKYSALFHVHPILVSVLTPLGILAGAAIVRLAPMAGGSGVPQVLYAAELARNSQKDPTEQELVSARTAAVKAISTAIGFFSGASIGAEGPMVQISTSIFAEMARTTRKLLPQVDFQSYIAAGAGTGIAAAFNAPLGGIAFALEEVATSVFGELRQYFILAIIIAGLTADALVGKEFYFGRPDMGPYEVRFIGWAVLIGMAGGFLGALFGKVVTSDRLRNLSGSWWKRALIFGVLVALLDYFFQGETGGSNYFVTRNVLAGQSIDLPLSFPLAKLFATAFSTLSGLGGGILTPSLSVGAWLGISTAKIASFANFKVCALLGMVAYFSGAFQIPITAVIVVMEITNQHDIIFPMMISALVAYSIARIFMPTSLYHLLIQKAFERAPGFASQGQTPLPYSNESRREPSL